MTIRITVQKKIIVTIPFQYNEKKAHDFVERKKKWIEKHLMEIEEVTPISRDNIQWGEQQEKQLLRRVEHYYQCFGNYQIPKPKVTFRKMKSRWGSCNKTRATITLNKALAEIPEACADYVIVHELSHLVEANHQKGFYKVMKSVMPDYQEYEERLKKYALQD